MEPVGSVVYSRVSVYVTVAPIGTATPSNVNVQPDKLLPGPIDAVHANEHPVVSETVTVSEPERVASALPSFVIFTVYTVTPDVTPWMGVPVGVLVYPNSESFRIGLGGKFTNVTVGPLPLCAWLSVRMTPIGLLGSGLVPFPGARLLSGTTIVPMFT